MLKGLSSSDQILAGIVAAALILDVPAARAYYEHTSLSESLGRYLFHGLKELTGLPIPFTPFEVLSYSTLLLIILAHGLQTARYWIGLVFLAWLVPVVCGVATAGGLLRGNSLDLAFTQLHFVPLLSVWLCIGYYVGTRPQLLGRVVRILFWVCLIRSVYALYVFFGVFQGTLADREYLIDHPVSLFLAAGLAYAAVQIWYQRRMPYRVLSYGLGLLLMAAPYVINDRRASFAGLIAALLLLPWILPQRIRRAILQPYSWAMAACLVILVAFALRSSDPHSFVGALRTETLVGEKLTYRHIENYNLLVGMIQQPLTGLGFGTKFPTVMPLPDISFAFELYDAIPHNTLYFLWTFGGPMAIAALMTLSCGVLLVIARVGRLTQRKSELLVSVISLVVICQWLMYVLFDMGLLESRSLMMVGIFAGAMFPLYARLIMEQRYVDQEDVQVLAKHRHPVGS